MTCALLFPELLGCLPPFDCVGHLLMRLSFPLYRWFKNTSIARKLYLTVGTMALLIGVELFFLFFSLHTLSSLRAYVGGEGLWSKAQKDAVFYLYRYGVSHSDTDYRLFRKFMEVPIGDADARNALLKGDIPLARQGFLQGRNNPDDIDGMISLFVNFGSVSYIHRAIKIWGDAQPMVMRLLPIGEALHAEINSPAPSDQKINALLGSVYQINKDITTFEDEFSFTLGAGSRWLERVVLRLLYVVALTVEITGLLLTLSVSRGIHKGLTEVIGVANALASGELGARVKIRSRDEIGLVGTSFNEMAENLQTRVKELAELTTKLSGTSAQLETALRELQHETDERLRAEEVLRQSEKMRALGQLAGGIAHDFNNLLGVIIGGIEILEDAVQDDPEYSELASSILNSALNGSLLLRRLLAVGRNQPLQPEQVDLNALLVDVVTMLRRTIGETIEIEAVRAPDLWFTTVDPSQVHDALLNLALNARDAMPHGGKIKIEAANCSLDVRDATVCGELYPGDFVVVTMTDTGTGMPEAVLERAVEPFFTTKPPSAGSGLGLSMVYGFAKQSGGHLDIESTVGIGTRVRLFLPRARGYVTTRAKEPLTAIFDPTGTETILLVEDNLSLLEVTRRSLTAWGYKVIAAQNARMALTMLESSAVADLLFTDIIMPGGMSGWELAGAAKRIQPHLKVLFTTGYATESLERQEEFMLRKPYNRSDLARAIRSILDGVVTSGTKPHAVQTL